MKRETERALDEVREAFEYADDAAEHELEHVQDGGEYALDRLQDGLEGVRDAGCYAHFCSGSWDSWVVFVGSLVGGFLFDG